MVVREKKHGSFQNFKKALGIMFSKDKNNEDQTIEINSLNTHTPDKVYFSKKQLENL